MLENLSFNLLRTITGKRIKFNPASPQKNIVIYSCISPKNLKKNYNFYELIGIALLNQLGKMGWAGDFAFKNERYKEKFSAIKWRNQSLSQIMEHPGRFGNPKTTYKERHNVSVELNIDAKTCKLNGIEIWAGLVATIQNKQKRYSLDFSQPETLELLELLIENSCHLLSYLNDLVTLAKAEKAKIWLIGNESGHFPNSIFILLSSSIDNKYLQYCDFNRFNIHYFGLPRRSPHVAIRTMAGIEDHRGWIDPKELKSMQKEGFFERRGRDAVKQVRHRSRTMIQPSNYELEFLDKLKFYKAQGKKIYCLFSHLFYDVGLHEKNGDFDDMLDWVKQTVEIFSQRKDSILILKPHPGEGLVGGGIEKETLECFYNSLNYTNENIIILDSIKVSAEPIYPLLTAALVWRSSVGMELPLIGTPTVICGRPYYRSLPLNYVTSRQAYENFIDSPQTFVTEETKSMIYTFLGALRYQIHKRLDFCKIDYETNTPKIKLMKLPSLLRGNNRSVNALISNMKIDNNKSNGSNL